MIKILIFSLLVTSSITAIAAISDSVTVYSSRKEHLIKPLFDAFTKDTGIKVSYLTGKGGALIERLKLEGKNTKADMFMTVDAGNLWYAGSQGVFQKVKTKTLENNIPAHLRDPEGLWTGLSVRARTIVYNTKQVNPKDLSTYANLALPQWEGRLCLRTSKKIYTKSLVASLIYHHGESKAGDIVSGWVNNLAATPNAKDSHVMNAILSGQCDVGLVNTYYYGRLVEKKPNLPLKLFWANQNTTGVHVNISGAGVTKYAKNPKAATRLLEWLSSAKAQAIYGALNQEYPANQSVALSSVVSAWGAFKQDKMNLSQAGILQATAVKLMQKKGYR
ncbi:Ferric iron ABC transporter, iron-binding protein [uncultured Gammaproteobacteria bacterium]|jgi:iron(III) transport system substrate-binding protein|nr:Ferric iron ABC transporter, iron-binding protein [Bathymodiolus brooksi thiotrophic gill symbiont]CAC9544822.1 Ferric iron ABC transporter, iron-binding protein [uncultured Gammaproteobacteria bacterium]CAC9553611.1 Ferric iron ABC transporter, iron-binding protein [uncultured Gammaproteobacteria bacterium]CAC9561056.1 Ferric iron ABC transporter, iron-binding protein [uncultured Gammaproteobacteria bacterium]CAC9614908.1 Ferric iron ABC transporter, iron-binding protein [uncultured Gammapr